MAKEVKSIRLSVETVQLIEKQEGSNFSDKVDKLLYKCVLELPQKQRELKAVQQQISRERQELEYIRKQQSELSRHIRSLNATVQSAERETARVVKQLEALTVDKGDGNG